MVVVAIVHGLAPADVIPEGILPLALVVIGLVWGAVCLEEDKRMAFMVLAVALGGAATANVLTHVHVVGVYLDTIVDALSIALYAGVVAAYAMRLWGHIMPSGES